MQPMVNMALRAARAAGDIIVRAFADLDKLKIETKERNDFVTEVDKASEQTIIAALRKAYSRSRFLRRGIRPSARQGGRQGLSLDY